MGFCITYDILYVHYTVHTKYVEVHFNKYKMGLPYIDSKKTQYMAFVKTVQKILEGSPKNILPQRSSLANLKELLDIHLGNTSNIW